MPPLGAAPDPPVGRARGRGRLAALLLVVLVALLLLAGRLPRPVSAPGPDRPARSPPVTAPPAPAAPDAEAGPAALPTVPPDAPSPARTRLAARILFEDTGETVGAGVEVSFIPSPPIPGPPGAPGVPFALGAPRATTDGSGAFVLEGLPGRGPHSLFLEGDRFGVGLQSVTVEVPPGPEETVLRVERRFVVVGTVRTAEGPPIEGAEVHLRAEGEISTNSTQAASGPGGRFRLEVDAIPETFRVGAAGVPGRLPTAATLSRIAPGLVQAEIAMPSGPVVRGRVVDGKGRPMHFQLVWVYSEARSSAKEAEEELLPMAFTATSTLFFTGEDDGTGLDQSFNLHTAPDGTFTFTPFLPACEMWVKMDREGCRTVCRSVGPMDPADLTRRDLGDLVLAPGAPIRIQFLLPDGRAATGMDVSFENRSVPAWIHPHAGSATTDADGWLTSPALEEGVTYAYMTGSGYEGPLPRLVARDGMQVTLAKPPLPNLRREPGEER